MFSASGPRTVMKLDIPYRDGLVLSMTASLVVGLEFTPLPGHTKDHHKNITRVATHTRYQNSLTFP